MAANSRLELITRANRIDDVAGDFLVQMERVGVDKFATRGLLAGVEFVIKDWPTVIRSAAVTREEAGRLRREAGKLVGGLIK